MLSLSSSSLSEPCLLTLRELTCDVTREAETDEAREETFDWAFLDTVLWLSSA